MDNDNEAELTACLIATIISGRVRKRSGNIRAALMAYEAARDVLRTMIESDHPLEALDEVALLEDMWTQT